MKKKIIKRTIGILLLMHIIYVILIVFDCGRAIVFEDFPFPHENRYVMILYLTYMMDVFIAGIFGFAALIYHLFK